MVLYKFAIMNIRQEKIASLLHKELGSVFHKESRTICKGAMVSVTVIRLSPDLSIAKVYLSIFPSDNAIDQLTLIQKNAPRIKHDLAKVLKGHLRKVPELVFFLDDSLDYIDSVEDSINNPDNSIL